jgi:hypothetical protein
MAIFPCDVKSHRYPGAQQTVYAALVDGTSSYRRKMRLCPEHFDLTVQLLESRAHSAQMPFDNEATTRCLQCQREVTDGTWQFFATVYGHRQDRQDWWSVVHDACAPSVCEDWSLPLET